MLASTHTKRVGLLLPSLGLQLVHNVTAMSNSHSSNLTGLTSSVGLNNGLKLPVVGLGVYQTQGEDGKNAVLSALKLGYRHIDTAQGYHNEAEVGEAVRASGVPREQIWITTKVTWQHFVLM